MGYGLAHAELRLIAAIPKAGRALLGLGRKSRTAATLEVLASVGLAPCGALVMFYEGPLSPRGRWSPEIFCVGVLAFGFGVAGLFHGLRWLVRPRQVPEQMSRQEFLARVRSARRPVSVCTHCRLLVAANDAGEATCERCEEKADFVVTSDADLRALKASLPDDGR